MASSKVLPLPDEIGKDLVNIAAQQGFRSPRIRVEAGSGMGYTSVMFRVRVDNEVDASEELNFVYKTTLIAKLKPFLHGNFMTEDIMYNEMLPAIADIAKLREPLPWPRCYLGSMRGRPRLVLHDLSADGFVMADRSKMLDKHHCHLALQQLARLHGGALALQRLRPTFFDDTVRVMGTVWSSPKMAHSFRGFWKSTVEDVPDMLKDRFSKEVVTKIREVISTFCNNFIAIMGSPGNGPGCTLIHGDSHRNNMMFQYNVGGTVTACKTIDFQLARYGNLVWDLHYLLFSATDKAMRDLHWDALLRAYHDELQVTIRASGIDDADAVYSWDQFMENMRREVRYGLSWAPLLLHALYATGNDGEEFRDCLAAMDESDGNETEEPPTFRVVGTPALRQHLGDVVQDLLEWGWL